MASYSQSRAAGLSSNAPPTLAYDQVTVPPGTQKRNTGSYYGSGPMQNRTMRSHGYDGAVQSYRQPGMPNRISDDETTMQGDYSEKKEDPENLMGRVETSHEGDQKFKQLGWKKLTVCLIVEAIALGSLSIPNVFATVGMVAGVLLSVGIGFIAIYTSYLVGQVKLRHPGVKHYADAVKLCFGRVGYEITGVMFVLLLVLLVGSHTLTGTIAWIRIVEKPGICALVWGIISAIILFLLALPPTFSEFAVLGYIDFISIISAIIICIVATGIEASKAPGGLGAVDWHVWPPPGVTFAEAFLSVTNVIFAYSFAVCQFSFMDEMHTPTDYVKSIWALGLIEIFIYTATGGLIYAFVGTSVQSPALLSAGSTVSRVAFGVALPVIFISGSINTTVVGRYIHGRVFANSPIRYIHSSMGWITWISLAAILTVIAWIIAEAVPFFNDLLGLISSLFISGFTFYFPAIFWFMIIKEGKWYRGGKNIFLSIVNGSIFLIGLAILGCGCYATIKDITQQYTDGSVGSPFSCDSSRYT